MGTCTWPVIYCDIESERLSVTNGRVQSILHVMISHKMVKDRPQIGSDVCLMPITFRPFLMPLIYLQGYSLIIANLSKCDFS